MTDIDSVARERQRFEHLVLARPRPRPEMPTRPKGMPKAAWKLHRAALLEAGGTLAPGVEEHVAMRERWSHKSQGTPETHEAAAKALARPGSLARLFASEAIDKEQLAAAEQICAAYRSITNEVTIRTANWEPHISGGAGDADLPRLSAVWCEFAYDWWRNAVIGPIDAILAIIVDDIGLTIVAERYGISTRRMRRMLVDALDLWASAHRQTSIQAHAAARG